MAGSTTLMKISLSNVDDYVVAPLGVTELISRMRRAARHRRPSEDFTSSRRIQVGNIGIDLNERVAIVDGAAVRLTKTECKIISIIAHSPGQMCARDHLLNLALGRADNDAVAVLHVHISRIRRKTGLPDIIELAPGYRLAGN